MPELNSKNELLLRVYFVLFLFVAFAALIAFRIVDIALVEGEYWRAKNKENGYVKWLPVPTQRGNIYAADNQSLLATSIEFFEVRMDPVASKDVLFYSNIKALCLRLAEFPGRYSAAEWHRKLVNARKNYFRNHAAGSRYILIAKQVDNKSLKRLKSYPLFNKGQAGGLIVEKRFVREKPYKDLAARTIGVHRDNNMVGIENSYDKYLKGQARKAYMKRLSGDLYVPIYDPTDYEFSRGHDIVTTIDVDLQDIVHGELRRGIQEHNAEGGVAILMEVKTGRIKAMSNLSRLENGTLGEYMNMAVARSSEPGSTIKAASALALLEDGLAEPSTLVHMAQGKKKFYDLWMHDSGNHGLEYATLSKALEISSNVGMASALFDKYRGREGWLKYYNRLMAFGFDQPTGIEIEGEPKPNIKHPLRDKKSWYGTTVPWMAHGYELTLTPLQLLNFYNAIANDGKLMKPQLVKAIKKDDETIAEYRPKVLKHAIARDENIKAIQTMLQRAVEIGTGKSLRSGDYRFAGKTGTTKVCYACDADDVKYNASFAGYWPAEDPKYSMIVVVYGLKGSKYYGNVVAGPIFKNIMDWSFSLEHELVQPQFVQQHNGEDQEVEPNSYSGKVYGYADDYDKLFDEVNVKFSKSSNWIVGRNNAAGEVVTAAANIRDAKMPNLSGMGLRDALYVLENLGAKVRTQGSGRVVRQSISPGTKIGSQEITLYLN